MEERVDIYVHVSPLGILITIEAPPFPVDNTISGEEDIFESPAASWQRAFEDEGGKPPHVAPHSNT